MAKEFLLISDCFVTFGDRARSLAYLAERASLRNAELVGVSPTGIYHDLFTAFAEFSPSEASTTLSLPVLFRIRAADLAQANNIRKELEYCVVPSDFQPLMLLRERTAMPPAQRTFYVRPYSVFEHSLALEQAARECGGQLVGVACDRDAFEAYTHEPEVALQRRHDCLFSFRAGSHQEAKELCKKACDRGATTSMALRSLAWAWAELPSLEAHPERWDEEICSDCNIRRDMHELANEFALPYVRAMADDNSELAGAYGMVMNNLEAHRTRLAAWKFLMEQVVTNPYCLDGVFKRTVAGILQEYDLWFHTRLTRRQVIRLYQKKQPSAI